MKPEYFVDLEDPRFPSLVRIGGNGIEAYHPRKPGRWEKSEYYNDMSEEDFASTFTPCSEKDARKYMAMIEKNVKAMDQRQ